MIFIRVKANKPENLFQDPLYKEEIVTVRGSNLLNKKWDFYSWLLRRFVEKYDPKDLKSFQNNNSK